VIKDCFTTAADDTNDALIQTSVPISAACQEGVGEAELQANSVVKESLTTGTPPSVATCPVSSAESVVAKSATTAAGRNTAFMSVS
jgi:hypothetical protein